MDRNQGGVYFARLRPGLVLVAVLLAACQASARVVTFSNANSFPVVVLVNSLDLGVVRYYSPAGSVLTLTVDEKALGIELYDPSTDTSLRAWEALPGGDVVAYDDGTLAVVGVQSRSTVHVSNPVQGMEFVLFSLGFLCCAVVWRFILGRW